MNPTKTQRRNALGAVLLALGLLLAPPLASMGVAQGAFGSGAALELTDEEKAQMEILPPPEIQFRDFIFSSTLRDRRFALFGMQFFARVFDEVMDRGVRPLFAPAIEEVKTAPEKPNTWDVVGISADLSVQTVDREKEVDQAVVYYGGGEPDALWESAEMNPTADPFRWETLLPPSPSRDVMRYFLLARDESGNLAVEAPCPVASWPPKNDPCMTMFAFDEAQEPRMESALERKDADIYFAKFGQDERHYHIALKLREPYDPGTLTPPELKVFYVMLFQPATSTRQRYLSKTITLLYNPYLEQAMNLFNCSVMMRPSDKWSANPGPVRCQTQGDEVYFRVDKDIFDRFDEPYLELYAGSFLILSVEPAALRLTDATNFARVYTKRERSYKKSPKIEATAGEKTEARDERESSEDLETR